MRVSFHVVTLVSLLVSLMSNDPSNLAEAAKLRRGSAKQNDEISEMSLRTSEGSGASDGRSLLSLSIALTDAEVFALKKTPGLLKSSKCGGPLYRSLGDLRKHHPGCLQVDEEDSDQGPGTLPSAGAPTLSPTTPMPPTSSPTTTIIEDPPLNCIHTVLGNEISIPYSVQFREKISTAYLSYDDMFRKGEMLCLALDDGQVAHFGYTWSNEFGLFVNGESVWKIPEDVVTIFDHWTFEEDGNLALRDASGGAIWTSMSHGNFGSRLKVSFERVLIEDDVGNTLWSQPPYLGPPVPTNPPTPPPTGIEERPLNCVQTVVGSQLTIPIREYFERGDVHCLFSEDGRAAYFGYTWSNQFGLFVNDRIEWTAAWTAEDASVAAVDRWSFQADGNLVLRNVNNQGIWRTHSCCRTDSQLKVSMERVWIETNTGNSLWAQPPNTVSPTPPPNDGDSDGIIPTSLPSNLPTNVPTTNFPTNLPSQNQDRPLNCVQTVVGNQLTIPIDQIFRKGDVHCLKLDDGTEAYFGYTWSNQFGFFVDDRIVWTAPDNSVALFDRWSFQDDGNLVLRDASGGGIWRTGTAGNWGSHLRVSPERVWIERSSGYSLWSQPPYLGPPRPLNNEALDVHSGLQYYAYYYPWYHRNNWGRHNYQDEPLLGKYGTDEVAVAEQHVQWALEAGISTWIVSYWGQDHLASRHFKAGMMNAPSLSKMNFCMLYESVILDGRGSWHDGSKEEALYEDLKEVRDDFLNHPSYLRINGRPVIIFYITRSRMPYENGFNGPSVLANMRRRLGHNIYFIADEPFFDWNNKSPDGNRNAFKGGKQVFDAYTTYNMFQDSRVRRGETATDYQLREAMPVWKRWADELPLFPNVMPQYYDFRGHKPLLGNTDDFMKQLREVACLPRTNFDGAPHIMMITSFNEWWEGTQIEPENGSSGNWNNYGFQFMETLAAFKKEVDSRGTYWC
ncbi:MAG: hypothetical protein SGBAC_007079 [Bacillariaceae sp.]